MTEVRQPARLDHGITCGYLVEYRTVLLVRSSALTPEAGGYILRSGSWTFLGEFPTVQDAEYEVDATRLAGGRTLQVRWRALVSSDRFE